MKQKSSIAHLTKSVLDCILRSEMVTISSPMLYQEKMPEELCRKVTKSAKEKAR